MSLRRERLVVRGNEGIGPYRLVRLARGTLVPGEPGQFFMVEAPGCLLPRPFSLCLAPVGELGFLVDAVGPGTAAIAALDPGDEVQVLGPLGRGFDLSIRRPLLVGGGVGMAPFPYLRERLPGASVLLGFRSPEQAEAAVLLPGAEVVLGPALVTDALPADPGDILACGPEGMLEAVRRVAPSAQRAAEAPMACGYGACFGCVVEHQGRLIRLCVEGPVLRAAVP